LKTIDSFHDGVLLGDCLKVLRQLPDESVDFILTDPPYLVRYQDRHGRGIINDDNSRWLFPAFAELYRVLKPNRFCVSFYGWNQAQRFLHAWRECGFWISGHFAFIKFYASNVGYVQMKHENAYLLAKGQPEKPTTPPPDVLRFEYSGNKLHPTQKPVSALTPLIEAFSRPGDLVLDPFAGSGTTGIAARSCRRRFVLIEKDAAYHRAARQRLQRWSITPLKTEGCFTFAFKVALSIVHRKNMDACPSKKARLPVMAKSRGRWPN